MSELGRLVETMFPTDKELLVRFDLWGVECSVHVHGSGNSLHDSIELISFTTHLDFGDSSLSMTSRMVRPSIGDYYLLVNGTMKSPTTIVSVVIDPFMTIFDHFIEVTGIVNGRCIDIVLPEFNYYQEVSFSLSQVPGLGRVLSNIPLPIPGVKAEIDAGFYLKFAVPNLDHPVINEYEQNPFGRDSGNEWIEIYNPEDTAISLSGWSLRTAHGIIRIDDIGDTIILPRCYAIYRYNGQALDNGDSSRFPFAESVALIDPSGRKVDSSPYTFDEENDGRTWQRSFDAGDSWEFRAATKGLPNSHLRLGPIDEEGISHIILITMTEALEQLEALGYDLDSLGKVMETAVNNLLVRLLDLLFERVAEVGLFIQVSFMDETGALSTGFKTSLLVDGNFLPEAFAWFGEVVRELLNDPLNPISSKTTRAGIEILTENIWVKFSVQTQAGLPELFASGFEGLDFKVATQVKANIAQLGEFLDLDLGRSQISAGLLVSGSSTLAITDMPFARGRSVNECWLIKMTLSER
jgi:hypothetical protein